MTTQTEALKLALEALDRLALPKNADDIFRRAIVAVKEALAQPEQNLKLMPREATPEMLKAMDECSKEGYDERLYAGHASSVYMAAWDAFHGQHCYCGDITNLGVIHRDDGPCHYPDHKEPEQEPVAWMDIDEKGATSGLRYWSEPENRHEVALYTSPLPVGFAVMQKPWFGLTDEEIWQFVNDCVLGGDLHPDKFARIIETKLKEKNT